MTMFRDVYDNRFFPAEQEITNCCAEYYSETQPDIVCHEDQHEEIRQHNLHNVQERLKRVHP